ncbi:hypothetical protein [Stutzerimonas xanthomarina]|uniref:hypothetical protein n=1 Tax=Stutzerimonas xanthomarina TaxID=271420 RepID=UPI003AA84D60
MNLESKAEQLITKLLRETYEGAIQWHATDAPKPLTLATDDAFPLFLSTNYKGIDVGLYQKRSKYIFDPPHWCWTEKIGLCVYRKGDLGGIFADAVIWQYEENLSSLNNLFSAAREQASGIDSILDGLLK